MTYSLAEEIYTTQFQNNPRFAYIGEGVSRKAYLCKTDGKIYKIESSWYDNVNYHEAAVTAFFRENLKIPGIIWPEILLHEVRSNVFVSEVNYYEHDSSVPTSVYNRVITLLSCLGVFDAGYTNVFSCKGFVVPIDLGCFILDGETNPWEIQDYIPNALKDFRRQISNRVCLR